MPGFRLFEQVLASQGGTEAARLEETSAEPHARVHCILSYHHTSSASMKGFEELARDASEICDRPDLPLKNM
jgi:hypothetical protein